MFTIPGTPMPEPGIYSRQRREPDYTELVEIIGARRAKCVMRAELDSVDTGQFCPNHAHPAR